MLTSLSDGLAFTVQSVRCGRTEQRGRAALFLSPCTPKIIKCDDTIQYSTMYYTLYYSTQYYSTRYNTTVQDTTHYTTVHDTTVQGTTLQYKILHTVLQDRKQVTWTLPRAGRWI